MSDLAKPGPYEAAYRRAHYHEAYAENLLDQVTGKELDHRAAEAYAAVAQVHAQLAIAYELRATREKDE